jgi:hypothetical protein
LLLEEEVEEGVEEGEEEEEEEEGLALSKMLTQPDDKCVKIIPVKKGNARCRADVALCGAFFLLVLDENSLLLPRSSRQLLY